jgi:hypothetical protein
LVLRVEFFSPKAEKERDRQKQEMKRIRKPRTKSSSG